MNLHKKKKMISLALALLLTLGLFPGQSARAAAAGFPDVAKDDWFYTNVTDLAAAGIVKGYPDGNFYPRGNVTVGEALKLVLLAAGYSERAATGTHWASGYASLASSTGMLTSAEVKNLDAPITRLTVAKLAAQALGVTQSADETPFADIQSGWATSLYEKGILTGTTDSGQRLLMPTSNIQRSEISAIVWRERAYRSGRSVQTFNFYGRTLEQLPGVAANGYDAAAFSTDANGVVSYGGSGMTTRQGIDVSQFQGDIDWAKVKAAGVKFAILRVGGRYSVSGALYDDTKFAQNIKGALSAGIDVGVYFFSQAVTADEAQAEADYTLSKIKGYELKMPVVFDWEPYTPSSGTARTANLDGGVLTRCAQAFCERVSAAGYTPMVYSNQTVSYLRYDLRGLSAYPFWLAEYHAKTANVPVYRYDFDIWQYSSTGAVDGIAGDVDLDIQFIR